ncbi:hypothetical protein ANCDUO_05403 [Ancylostoma duodenale]|uniref:Uncharacterized protein n=1 Tax=Ancylostoma duodenale TaxID=51022 RepID=A0A0C2DNM1_9BILA|nr:hypothetical protein ANCDUO_05403 [Ancylostoma duodenale]
MDELGVVKSLWNGLRRNPATFSRRNFCVGSFLTIDELKTATIDARVDVESDFLKNPANSSLNRLSEVSSKRVGPITY